MKRNKAAELGEAFVDTLREVVAEVVAEQLSARPSIKPRLLNAEQAGIYIGRSKWSVYELQKEGRIETTASDRRILFDVHDLDAFIEREKDASQPHKQAA